MVLFGHLGLGYKAVERWLPRPQSRTKIFWKTFALGALGPDLIDKPLYYFLSWQRGMCCGDLGLISGTRTFGHALLLFLLMAIAGSLFPRRDIIKIFLLAWLSHLILDHVVDFIDIVTRHSEHLSSDFQIDSPRIKGLLFPFLGLEFPDHPYPSWKQHFFSKISPVILVAEAIGLWVLLKNRRNIRA